MKINRPPSKQELEETLTTATAHFVAASFVVSAPAKFTQREVAQATEQRAAAKEFLLSLGYDPENASLVEHDPQVPGFLAELSGKNARMPRTDGAAAWIIPANVYLEVMGLLYPSYNA